MEGYRVMEPFAFDRTVLCEADTSLTKVMLGIIYQAAVHFKWRHLTGTAENFKIYGSDTHDFFQDPENFIWTQSYDSADTDSKTDVLMLHLFVDPQTKKWDAVAYVFPRPKVPGKGLSYFEHAHFNVFQEDSRIIFQQKETYAYSADIHDHDSYEVIARAIYDIPTKTLYYPEG